MFRASWRNCAVKARELLEPFSVRSDHHYCHQWWQNCASKSVTRAHLTVRMQLTYPMFEHTLYQSVHLSLIHIYISHPHTLTLIIYLKKLVTIKVQTKIQTIKDTFFAFRRQKKERHSSYSQIYNYSSLKG